MTWRERRIITLLGTLLLVLLAVLLVVLGIRYRERRAAAEDGNDIVTETETAPLPAYTALTYQNSTATLSFSLDEEEVWHWDANTDFPLDDQVVTEVLDLLQSWTPQQTLTDEESLSDSGVEDSTVSVTATASDGTVTTVRFGKATTDGDSYYARLGDDETTVYIVADTLYQLLQTPIYEMCRLPELPELDGTNLNTITIQGAAQEDGSEGARSTLSAQRPETGAAATSWRANGANVTSDATVQALLEDLTSLTLAKCVDYSPSDEAAAICGMDEPSAQVFLTYTADGLEQELTLTIGEQLPDGSGRYTRVNGEGPIYLLETDLLDPLMRIAANGLE